MGLIMSAAAANSVMRLTPPGAAAIAVVRIDGPRVREFLNARFSTRVDPMRCVHGNLRDGERVLDDPLVILHESATRADINLHGGEWVVQACIELAQRDGFQLVNSARPPIHEVGVDAGSMIELEMLSHLPLAITELGMRALLAQPGAWESLGAREAVPSGSLAVILNDRALFWLLHPPRVAIVGAANVGKSTLANQLFTRDRSIAADVPGTTRDWVGEIANIDGLPVMLIDTPGLRGTHDAIESEAIARSRRVVAEADLLVVVLDASRGLDEEQSSALREHPGAILVANKVDRPSLFDIRALDACQIVATTGGGVDELRRRICQRFGCRDLDPARARWWTVRQRDILERAIAMPDAIREI